MMSGDKKQRWIPLESNPEVLNKYIHNLGVPSEWEFVDIYGLDPDLLTMVPRPVAAVMLLYPITEKSEAEGSQIGEEKPSAEGVYYMKQTVGNACGTVALVHALANNTDKITFEENKHFSKFLAETLSKDPEARATVLEEDEGMGAAHEGSALEGQTKAPSRDQKVDTHFIAFVCRDGGLFELDGRKKGPIYHGKGNQDTVLEDSIEVVRKFMARDPDQLNFTLMALAKVA